MGAENSYFDVTSWRKVDLPHDFSIEDIEGSKSPLDSTAVAGLNVGFTKGGTAWYRKEFEVPDEWRQKRVEICFEGAYMNTDVWVNGAHIGNHPYGYTQFQFDITDLLVCGQKNTIAVQVKNEGNNSRWYSGSGLYRHVWLNVTNPLYIPTNGTYIVSSQVSDKAAKVTIETILKNDYDTDKEITLETTILNCHGEMIDKYTTPSSLSSYDNQKVEQTFWLKEPKLWSPDSPSLYTARTRVLSDGKIEDLYETTFGVRTISFDAQKGFLLNGKSIKLKGGCVHHDNGPLGAKAYDRAEERKAELLKNNGYNAVRASHNPPSVAFLNACDRIGLLVLDEAFDMWTHGKNPYDYHRFFKENWKKDIDAMIMRDRNHPSVIMWSIGNEIPAMDSPEVVANARMLANYIREIEPTRPITAGMNNLSEQLNDFCDVLDVCGYNYAVGGYTDKYETDIKNHPKRIVYGSESYALDAYDAWKAVEENIAIVGDFVWTAIDYIGEASIGWHGYPQYNVFPWTLAYCSDIDICGWKRPQSYYRNTFWDETPSVYSVIHSPSPSFDPLTRDRIDWSRWHYDDVVDSWNWEGYERKPLTVDIYSSCDSVELMLNDHSFGVYILLPEDKNKASFVVPYAPGTLMAVGYKQGQKTTHTIQTTGQAEAIRLSADRSEIFANGQDLCYVTVELIDKNGLRDVNADNLVRFSLKGNGSIVGVGNANPISLESYTDSQRKAWRGRCLVILKAGQDPASIELTASVEGLQDKTIQIKTK